MSLRKSILPVTAVLIFAATSSFSASPKSGFFKVYELRYSGDLLTYHTEDMNNDGLSDLLVFGRKTGSGGAIERWLSLFLQQPDGFSEKAQQTLKLPHDFILFDTGNIAGDAKIELVYFADGEMRYFALGETEFDPQPRTLLETESVFMLSDRKTVRRWDFVKDFNGDGRDDLFVQNFLRATVFLQKNEPNKWQANKLPLRTESRIYGYFDPRFSVGHKSDALYSTPYILLEDFNLDGRKDLLGAYKDSLVVFMLAENGTFSAESRIKIPLDYGDIWSGAKIQRTHLDDKSEKRYLMRIKDLNNDGLIDIVGTRLSTKESLINPETEVRIYYGKKNATNGTSGILFSKQPDAIIKPAGSMMVLDIIDINGDRRDDMIIPFVNIGVTQIIKMLVTRSVSIEAAYYAMQADGSYPEKPDDTQTLNVKFSFKGGAATPVYEIDDFNGDGLADVLSSSDEERLLIYWGKQNGFIHKSAGEKFGIQLPQDGTRVRAGDLNADRRADVVIVYDDDDRERKRLPKAIRVLLAQKE